VPTPTPTGPPPTNAATDWEKSLRAAGVRDLQARLCVPRDGVFGDATRKAIRLFETVQREDNPDGVLNSKEGSFLQGRNVCDTGRYRNYLENNELSVADNVKRLKTRMNALLPTGRAIAQNEDLNAADTRPAIASLKRACGVDNPLGLGDEEVTPLFLERVGYYSGEKETVAACAAAPPQ
jgi:peptidoglycan hydrolase-like protein with peptidoglycan-binding domain